MNTQNPTKINQLIKRWPRGTVGTQPWLSMLGINRFLAEYYCRAGWLERLAAGAYQIAGDKLKWSGAVYSLQKQLKLKIHIGAQTALELQGYIQFLGAQNDGVSSLWLFNETSERRALPNWFSKKIFFQNANTQKLKIYFKTRNLFLSDDIGLTNFQINDYHIRLSTPERAVLECFDLSPTHFSLDQGKFLMESMVTLRPQLLQTLLESCTSFKVKRLFLLFAENEGHSWFEHLNLKKIPIGQNKLMIEKGGHYYSKYKLSLPLDIKSHEGYSDNDTKF